MDPETRPAGRLLAIDMGTKTLGLALYTPAADLVSPLHTIKRGAWAEDLAALKSVMAEYDIEGLVVGYPLEMNGKEGARCQSVRAFVRNLRAGGIMLPLALHDERFSSAAAEEALLALDASRNTRRAVSDAVAAQVILESYVDGF